MVGGEAVKREEKNQQMRRNIMDSALEEFAARGYDAGSINAICAARGLSKGIIYHYFKTKDDLYLACVEECMGRLTDFLRAHVRLGDGTAEDQMEGYFTARLVFFREHPVYQRIFCDAVVAPPSHLEDAVLARKRPFDALNIAILSRLLEPMNLRPSFSREEVIDTFRQVQDFINIKYQKPAAEGAAFETRERSCLRALRILLYGVAESPPQV